MGTMERFLAYAAEFEKTYADDDWARLEPHFSEAVVYTVENVFFGCRVEGRDAVLRALRKSLDGFDRKTASRDIEVRGTPEVDGNRISLEWTVHYTFHGDAPPFDLIGASSAVVEGDVITEMTDRYPDGFSDEAEAFLAEHAPEMDPQYL